MTTTTLNDRLSACYWPTIKRSLTVDELPADADADEILEAYEREKEGTACTRLTNSSNDYKTFEK